MGGHISSATKKTGDKRTGPPGTSTGSNRRTTLRGMHRILALVNQKGGVGKSTTAVNLGAYLALYGQRVLICDLDPQANATSGLGIPKPPASASLYGILIEEKPLASAIVPTAVERLYLVPSGIDLAGAEVELVPLLSRETRLRSALRSLEGAYDVILLDCPPSLGLLTINALTATGEVLIPLQCEYYALEGLSQLLASVNLVQRHLNPDIAIGGVLLTMYDPRTRLADQVATEVRHFFKEKVFETVIPRNIRLAEAPSYGMPISLYDPTSRGAEAYSSLAREVLTRGRQPASVAVSVG
jgi:chromosome partitioning protein